MSGERVPVRRRVAEGLVLVSLVASGLPAVHAQQLVVEIEIVGPDRNQAAVRTGLNEACERIGSIDGANAAQVDLLNTCAALAPLADADPALVDGLGRLVPEEAFAVGDSVTDAADPRVSGTRSRVARLQAVDGPTGDSTGGGASADGSPISRLQVFVGGHVSGGAYTGRELQQDADLEGSAFALGLDHRFGEDLVLGAALGFRRHRFDFGDGAGGVSADSVDLTLFGTRAFRERGYVDLALDLGRGRHDLSRQISLVGLERVLATADTEVSTVALSAGVGTSLPVGGWSFGPYARGGFTSASVAGYEETADSTLPGFGSTLGVGARTVRSATVSFGGVLSRTFGTSFGVLSPRLAAELQLETQSEKVAVDARFLADPDGRSIAVAGDERDTAFVNVGLGTDVVLARGRSAFVYYETRLQHDYLSQYWFKAGFRWEL